MKTPDRFPESFLPGPRGELRYLKEEATILLSEADLLGVSPKRQRKLPWRTRLLDAAIAIDNMRCRPIEEREVFIKGVLGGYARRPYGSVRKATILEHMETVLMHALLIPSKY